MTQGLKQQLMLGGEATAILDSSCLGSPAIAFENSNEAQRLK
jgi:hypothetical protein